MVAQGGARRSGLSDGKSRLVVVAAVWYSRRITIRSSRTRFVTPNTWQIKLAMCLAPLRTSAYPRRYASLSTQVVFAATFNSQFPGLSETGKTYCREDGGLYVDISVVAGS